MERTPRILPSVVLLGLALGAVACGAHRLVAPAAPNAAPPRPSSALSRAVIVVSVDGLRPDAIATYQAAAIGRLVSGGSYTLSAHTIMPSKTLPSHTSMVTGEWPDEHGVLWNNGITHRSRKIAIPTIFSEARSRGYMTAAFFSKSKFSHLQLPGSLDFSQAPGGWFGLWPAVRTVTDIETYLASHAPNLLFVHLADADAAGHKYGWMSDRYGKAVGQADAAIGRIVAAADRAYGPGLFTIIVTADHGGHDRGHGSDDARDVTIPWIAWGQGVAAGRLPDNSVRTIDTAATVLYLLGIDRPASWAGTAVAAAFAAPGG
jgi:arylsulfatase A-like enzyme